MIIAGYTAVLTENNMDESAKWANSTFGIEQNCLEK
jgi:hypothetical protein